MGGHRKKKSRVLRLTSWGKALLLFSGVILFAALTTGRNVIYLVFSLMVSFMLVSSVVATISLHRLRFARLIPQHIFSGRPFVVQTTVTNDKKLFSSFSLMVSNIFNQRELKGRYVPKLPAESSVCVAHKYLIERRGRHTFHGIRVATTYPVELFLKGYVATQPETIVVYPRIVKLNLHFLRDIISEIEDQVNRPGLGTDLYGFRKYQNDDDSRFINWKLSAKTRDLVVTKYCREENLKVCVVFDNLLHRIDESSREKFESAVTLAASLCSFFIDRGYKVKLVSGDKGIPYGEGDEQLYEILEHLALIEPKTGEEASTDFYSPGIMESGIGLLVYCEEKPRDIGNFSHVFDGAKTGGM